MLSPDQIKAKVRGWASLHSGVIHFDAINGILLDVASGKRLQVDWAGVSNFEEKIHPESRETYLVMMFDEGSQIALADPGGIAFAPSTENTGPIANLPPVVCLRDFLTLKSRVDHSLYDHPDEPPPRECLELLMICIATLDGARAVGFDVGDFEGGLEKSLTEIERRTN